MNKKVGQIIGKQTVIELWIRQSERNYKFMDV